MESQEYRKEQRNKKGLPDPPLRNRFLAPGYPIIIARGESGESKTDTSHQRQSAIHHQINPGGLPICLTV